MSRRHVHRRGFTLLEVLLAVALLAVVSVAALGWIAGQGRASRAARARLANVALAMGVARMIDDDLLLAVPDVGGQRWKLVDERTLALVTLDQVPGDEVGFHALTWRYDAATRTLLRGPAEPVAGLASSPRVVAALPGDLAFVQLPSGELQLLFPSGDAAATTWTVPLHDGGR